jgi:hypothetical protein
MFESPLTAKYGSKYMPKYAQKIFEEDLMTANKEETGIPGCIS